ncbi:M15 family metallopeptidase [Streptomyces sp. NPDC051561]|uniref:M15 family metallopeptidase n=1 Tax=Streptomyces sp. NPDC051561 TaxID=3365658 RepID=UPI0037A05925
MTQHPPSVRTTTHRAHWLLAICLAAALVAIVVAVGRRAAEPSSWPAVTSAGPPSAVPPPKPSAPPSPHARHSEHRGGPADGADGVVPDGVTVFDDATAAVTKLDPDLLRALRRAASAAADARVTFYVNSGWRSPEYQNRLLREAVAKYGSEAEAKRWVATATTSPHVSGDAIDIGRSDATVWLAEHGARYGLCQIYGNEPWHYELRPRAADSGCPPLYADPTHDPRMQR